eukprot:14732848-Ditylum_brightwellii.AAC.1
MGENAERENNNKKESESEEEEKNEGFEVEETKEQKEKEGVVSTIDEDIDEEEKIFMTKMRKKMRMMGQWRMR